MTEADPRKDAAAAALHEALERAKCERGEHHDISYARAILSALDANPEAAKSVREYLSR